MKNTSSYRSSQAAWKKVCVIRAAPHDTEISKAVNQPPESALHEDKPDTERESYKRNSMNTNCAHKDRSDGRAALNKAVAFVTAGVNEPAADGRTADRDARVIIYDRLVAQ
ncbi:hypothetical protein EVAR_38507_1 [Eumeta japonica]|uniref:Uncharacterized protein n=1 Tax=Eumeta variegata TaxID=151549 RepID=A0A4C1WEI5_EUMVA|nr:hypothetical protein EVAR_38507_1 [Eumeta japonica]